MPCLGVLPPSPKLGGLGERLWVLGRSAGSWGVSQGAHWLVLEGSLAVWVCV